MPVIILDKTFVENPNDREHKIILAAISKLPTPTIKRQKTIDQKPFEKETWLDEDKRKTRPKPEGKDYPPEPAKKKLLLLQREVGLLDRKHIENPIHSIGAKYLAHHVFLLLWNKNEEYLAVHADESETFDLCARLENFADTSAFSAMMIGGMPQNKDTTKCLQMIIQQLLIASKKLKCDIRIETQCLLTNNQIITPDDETCFAFNSLALRANQLSFILYGRKLDSQRITAQHYDALENKELTDETEQTKVHDFIMLLLTANSFNNTKFLKELKKWSRPNHLSDENLFYDLLLTLAFSKTGADLLIGLVENEFNAFGEDLQNWHGKLNHFVIDLDNKTTLTTINPLCSTVRETTRYLQCLTDLASVKPQEYSLAYHRQYLFALLNNDFMKAWLEASWYYQCRQKPITFTDENIRYICDKLLKVEPNKEIVRHYLPLLQSDYTPNPEHKEDQKTRSFNFTHKAIDTFYQPTTQAHLLKILGQSFEKRQRIRPSNVTDALLVFLSLKEANKYIKKSKLKKITINIIKFQENELKDNKLKDCKHFFVCLPAINFKPQSDNIKKLTEKEDNVLLTEPVVAKLG
jgi:hypothetical protein